MKVLHVSDADRWTGGCAQMLALARGLKERGHASWVACRRSSALAKASTEQGLTVFPVALRQDYDALSAWRLAALAEREGFDVIHCHHSRSHGVCLLAQLILKTRGTARPALVVSRRVSFKRGRNPFSAFKYGSGLNDAYAAVAGAVRDVLVSDGVDPERVAVIHSGVDLARFEPRAPDPAVRRSLRIPDACLAVGKVANAAPWKGQSVFLEAAAKLASGDLRAHFVLVGRDTDGPELRREVERLGLSDRVTLAGFREDIPAVLACLSASVNAAVGGEGLSGVLRESLAMGVPVVASDVAGNRELLGEAADRFLFPAGDSGALAQRLSWILAHEGEARARTGPLQERVRREFSVEAMLDKTERLYEAVIERCRARRPAAAPASRAALAGKALALAVGQAFLWVTGMLVGVQLWPAWLGEGLLGAAVWLSVGATAFVLAVVGARWLRLPWAAAIGALAAVPLAVLAYAWTQEPRLFMESLMADGTIRMIFIPDPSWKNGAIWLSLAVAAAGGAGWLAGRLAARD